MTLNAQGSGSRNWMDGNVRLLLSVSTRAIKSPTSANVRSAADLSAIQRIHLIRLCKLHVWRFPLLTDSPRAVSCEVIADDDNNNNNDGSKAASWLGGRNRAARIINLYIDFPADEKRHVDASAASHGD